jgi:hypothetical protein
MGIGTTPEKGTNNGLENLTAKEFRDNSRRSTKKQGQKISPTQKFCQDLSKGTRTYEIESFLYKLFEVLFSGQEINEKLAYDFLTDPIFLKYIFNIIYENTNFENEKTRLLYIKNTVELLQKKLYSSLGTEEEKIKLFRKIINGMNYINLAKIVRANAEPGRADIEQREAQRPEGAGAAAAEPQANATQKSNVNKINVEMNANFYNGYIFLITSIARFLNDLVVIYNKMCKDFIIEEKDFSFMIHMFFQIFCKNMITKNHILFPYSKKFIFSSANYKLITNNEDVDKDAYFTLEEYKEEFINDNTLYLPVYSGINYEGIVFQHCVETALYNLFIILLNNEINAITNEAFQKLINTYPNNKIAGIFQQMVGVDKPTQRNIIDQNHKNFIILCINMENVGYANNMGKIKYELHGNLENFVNAIIYLLGIDKQILDTFNEKTVNPNPKEEQNAKTNNAYKFLESIINLFGKKITNKRTNSSFHIDNIAYVELDFSHAEIGTMGSFENESQSKSKDLTRLKYFEKRFDYNETEIKSKFHIQHNSFIFNIPLKYRELNPHLELQEGEKQKFIFISIYPNRRTIINLEINSPVELQNFLDCNKNNNLSDNDISISIKQFPDLIFFNEFELIINLNADSNIDDIVDKLHDKEIKKITKITFNGIAPRTTPIINRDIQSNAIKSHVLRLKENFCNCCENLYVKGYILFLINKGSKLQIKILKLMELKDTDYQFLTLNNEMLPNITHLFIIDDYDHKYRYYSLSINLSSLRVCWISIEFSPHMGRTQNCKVPNCEELVLEKCRSGIINFDQLQKCKKINITLVRYEYDLQIEPLSLYGKDCVCEYIEIFHIYYKIINNSKRYIKNPIPLTISNTLNFPKCKELHFGKNILVNLEPIEIGGFGQEYKPRVMDENMLPECEKLWFDGNNIPIDAYETKSFEIRDLPKCKTIKFPNFYKYVEKKYPLDYKDRSQRGKIESTCCIIKSEYFPEVQTMNFGASSKLKFSGTFTKLKFLDLTSPYYEGTHIHLLNDIETELFPNLSRLVLLDHKLATNVSYGSCGELIKIQPLKCLKYLYFGKKDGNKDISNYNLLLYRKDFPSLPLYPDLTYFNLGEEYKKAAADFFKKNPGSQEQIIGHESDKGPIPNVC